VEILVNLKELESFLQSDQISTNETMLDHHSRDESYHTPSRPDVVVFPETTEDVRRIVEYASKYKISVVPYGVGSGLEGHVIPIRGGISIDTSRMNKILEVRADDFLVRVQPGVTKNQLNEFLAQYGLFFTVDPGADATVGGMAATNASGTTTVRYGVMRDSIRSMTVVLANGKVIETGTLAAKSSSGYDLTGLFVGSEGTLGVFTELVLRVHGLPEAYIAARATFPSVHACVKASTAIVGAGVPVTRIELADEHIIDAINHFSGTDFPLSPTLFIEFQGNRAALEESVELAEDIMKDEGVMQVLFVRDEGDRRKLWEGRHVAAIAFRAMDKGKEQMITDVCVPISELADAVREAREIIDEAGVHGGIVGHVGDGNYHAFLTLNPNDEEELEKVNKVNEKLVEFALMHKGTCTGEHGVGLGKRKYQARQHGRALEVMQLIKAALDPDDIMNPGKLIDPPL
jgi:D-lactate dehydrogenase (cytochrome)